LRIHGTGKINEDPASPYYPLMPTMGCISQRENSYGEVEYKDQRQILDTLMIASGLDPVFENEEKLLGLLYVIDIDDQQAPVTIETLRTKGIQ
jgi:hypothetical protein